jgi:tRNA (cytidine/uridine-2'-O-)-methyltransferase
MCLGVHAPLHLVHPLGFDLSESRVRRAGLDYWQHVNVTEHRDVEAFFEHATGNPDGCAIGESRGAFDAMVCLSAARRFGSRPLWECTEIGDVVRSGGSVCLVLGSETHGVEFLTEGQRTAMAMAYLPQSPAIRSMNLAACASIALYEACRQLEVTQWALEAEADVRAPTGRWAGTCVEAKR